MSETKWTPGPWNIARINYADIYGGDGEMVALVPKGYPRTAANAQLIAAAPDLYEALEAYEALDNQRMTCEECEDRLERAPEACEYCFPFADDARLKMRAALAKARGETA